MKLGTDVYISRHKFLKYDDFEYRGQKPLKEIKYFSSDFGVDDGIMAQMIDNFQPIIQT